MKPDRIKLVCVALLVVAWGIDMVTPQLFVAAILLNAPIALSSFSIDRRFTAGLVIAALVANTAAGYYNGLHDGGHWDAIAIGDRLLSGFSVLLVGLLTVAAQESGLRTGELAARQRQIQRESALRRAIEAIRSSLNVEVVYRLIVRQALRVFDADCAVLYMTRLDAKGRTTLRINRHELDITLVAQERPPELSSLITRAIEERDIVRLGCEDPLGRMALDTLGAISGMIAPIADRDSIFGVILVARSAGERDFDVADADMLRAFVEQSALALTQASLFVQLAEKNDEFAQANTALSERTNVIRDIVYALSHDLRTPLSAAKLTMRQALDGAYGPLPEPYREILQRSLAANAELQRLAETLLMVALYESGEQSRERYAVELAALADGVIADLRPLWESKGLNATLSGERAASVIGDESELRRALTNLVANAITSTPAGGSIHVLIGADPGAVTLSVEDDGYGVPQALREALFERFAGESRRGGGSGLGLYIVRRIIENHGGTVSYRPREPRGSAFSMTLKAPAGALRG